MYPWLSSLGTKGGKRIPVTLVDRRASQTKHKCVGKRRAHLDAQVTLLCTVSLVDHHDDVLTFIEHTISLAKLEDRGEHDLARVIFEQSFEF